MPLKASRFSDPTGWSDSRAMGKVTGKADLAAPGAQDDPHVVQRTSEKSAPVHSNPRNFNLTDPNGIETRRPGSAINFTVRPYGLHVDETNTGLHGEIPFPNKGTRGMEPSEIYPEPIRRRNVPDIWAADLVRD